MAIDQGYVSYMDAQIAAGVDAEFWRGQKEQYLADQTRQPTEEELAEAEAQAERERRAAELEAERLPIDYFPKLYEEALTFMRSEMIGPDDPRLHPLRLKDSAPSRAHALWARIDRDVGAADPGGALSAKANIKTKLLNQEAAERGPGDDVVAAIGRLAPGRTNWTTTGKPKCLPLSRAVGRRVSAAERDRALAEFRRARP